MEASAQGELKYSIFTWTGWQNSLGFVPPVQGQLTLRQMDLSVSIEQVSSNKCAQITKSPIVDTILLKPKNVFVNKLSLSCKNKNEHLEYVVKLPNYMISIRSLLTWQFGPRSHQKSCLFQNMLDFGKSVVPKIQKICNLTRNGPRIVHVGRN